MKFEYRLFKLNSPHVDAPINTREIAGDGGESRQQHFMDDLNVLAAEGWKVVLTWPPATHLLLERQIPEGRK